MAKRESILRRPPKQERSRERVEEILAAAKRLIGEKGIDAVKMREIAALAGGPISSVYQYFPNKSAILATLHASWSASLIDALKERLSGARSLDEVFSGVIAVFDIYYSTVRNDPAILDMLNAIQADKALNNLDVSETRQQAYLFCNYARPWIAEDRFDAFLRMTFLMFQLANGTVRLALAIGEDEAKAIVDDYKAVIHTQLMQFATDDGG